MEKQLISETQFIYNENNQLILKEKINSNKEVVYRKSIEYDDSNRIIKENIFELKFYKYSKSLVYNYNLSNNDYSIEETIDKIVDNNEPEHVATNHIEYIHDYDEILNVKKKIVNGVLSRITAYNKFNKDYYEKIVNENISCYKRYDSNNNLILEIVDGLIINMIYDEDNNNKIEEIKINKDGTKEVKRYEYDELNRLLVEEIHNKSVGNVVKLIHYNYFEYDARCVKSYYDKIDDEIIHKYDEVIIYRDNKKIYTTPEGTIEETYDQNNNLTKISSYK